MPDPTTPASGASCFSSPVSNILRAQGENTQSALRIEFTGPEQVAELESTVKSYIVEAISVEEADLEVPKKKVTEYEIPEEFKKRLRKDEEHRDAFDTATPGRKKGCLLHFSGAKRQRSESGPRRWEWS